MPRAAFFLCQSKHIWCIFVTKTERLSAFGAAPGTSHQDRQKDVLGGD